MKKAFVADASVAIAWCTRANPRKSRIACWTTSLPVASSSCRLWHYEVANALLVLWRRKKLAQDDYSQARMGLDRLPVAVDSDSPRLAVTQTTDFAMAHELTVYDAAYVELAVRRQIPLASRDQSLKRAAHRLGIPLLL